MPKVVLAYSGGLDTSVIVHWLKAERGMDVVTFSADLGQGEYLEPVAERALQIGAVSAHVSDVRKKFVEEYVLHALKAAAVYEEGYPLATALGRPLIAAELVKIAREEGCQFVAHGCTGKGNDQVRIESSVAALAPGLKIVAPLREWTMKSRDEEIDYCERNQIPIEVTKEKPYSYDRNLWGVSVECGILEDPWAAPPEDAYLMTKRPEDAPDEPRELVVSYTKGAPSALDGEKMSALDVITALNKIGGEHGVGRIDQVENRLVGIKSREVYEAPGAVILHTGLRALEALCWGRDVSHFAAILTERYARLIYDGRWFAPLRESIDAFFDRAHEVTTGDVRVKLYKGSCTVVGRRSDSALYDMKLATYTPEDAFDHSAAEGFIKIWSLPMKGEARQQRRK
ncbi:MAG: argininosuccinate synthase [Planctomycetota bacterium]|jgi:argininosuccinate synthase